MSICKVVEAVELALNCVSRSGESGNLADQTSLVTVSPLWVSSSNRRHELLGRDLRRVVGYLSPAGFKIDVHPIHAIQLDQRIAHSDSTVGAAHAADQQACLR